MRATVSNQFERIVSNMASVAASAVDLAAASSLTGVNPKKAISWLACPAWVAPACGRITNIAITAIQAGSADLKRATRFYETVLDQKLMPDSMGPVQMAVFPADKKQPTGCVIAADGYRPSADSTTVYQNLADDLSKPLARVEKAGGKVLLGKTPLPENMGFYAQFLDSEGNRVGFYSPK